MRKFRANIIGEDTQSENAATKLFLSAASRKMFMTKEKISINRNDCMGEQTKLSNFLRQVFINDKTALSTDKTLFPMKMGFLFIC